MDKREFIYKFVHQNIQNFLIPKQQLKNILFTHEKDTLYYCTIIGGTDRLPTGFARDLWRQYDVAAEDQCQNVGLVTGWLDSHHHYIMEQQVLYCQSRQENRAMGSKNADPRSLVQDIQYHGKG